MTTEGNVVVSYPPNIELIRAAFPFIKEKRGLLFSYAPFIHNPDNAKIPVWLLDHESVHHHQQWDTGGPELWWRRYLLDPNFRIDNELEACKAEYLSWLRNAHGVNRKTKAGYVDKIAERLSSGVYGYMVRRSAVKAMFIKIIA